MNEHQSDKVLIATNPQYPAWALLNAPYAEAKPKPVYTDPKSEAARLRWVATRNVLNRFMGATNLLAGRGTQRPNAILDYFWPFPLDKAR